MYILAPNLVAKTQCKKTISKAHCKNLVAKADSLTHPNRKNNAAGSKMETNYLIQIEVL